MMMLNVKGQHVLVLGLGKTGYSLARYLVRHGAIVTVADTRDDPPYRDLLAQNFPQVRLHCGALILPLFDTVSMIAVSPGVPKDQPLIQEAVKRGVDLVGDIELFARALPEDQKVLAITGTNGKTTTTSLTRALCEAAGFKAIAAGNIGEPVLDVLETLETGQPFPDVFVLELSSFQLETTGSLKVTAAAVLNVSGNHLDRYPSVVEYAHAKARIFEHAALQVLNADDAACRAMRLPDVPAYYFGEEEGMIAQVSALSKWTLGQDGNQLSLKHEGAPLVSADRLSLNGKHNAANALAALALTSAVIDNFEEQGFPQSVIDALCAFQGLPHRMETVGTFNGIRYINDSKATTVVATQAAVSGLTEPIVLILGGDGKKQDFAPLAETAAKHCRAVLLIGRDAALIAGALDAEKSVRYELCETLENAMKRARTLAVKGDCVLLSPACASWDQFKDYTERGKQFALLAKADPS
ncbi:MAG: UDP-N-acetylmuramoyl-L-alanine--D-glutamate ligase [Burkholderiales bacterium]|nr:UDP-N-acetylmuramoyl-L-alanine--D-glutamate ligase [Burkholderiales bacterium]